MNKWLAILLIYLGTCCYTMASFYHLSFKTNWSFWKAYLIAMIFVSIEYVFNIIGNKHANQYMNVIQIMILILAFYLINIYLMNVFVLKNRVNLIRESISMLLIVLAILISTNFLEIKV